MKMRKGVYFLIEKKGQIEKKDNRIVVKQTASRNEFISTLANFLFLLNKFRLSFVNKYFNNFFLLNPIENIL